MFDASSAWLAGLNPAQRQAATHGDSPLLVLAGAGTGKTATLAARVAHLLAEGAAPDRVCLLTFSRRAAQEMLARAARLAGSPGAGRVWGGTFHGVGNRILRLHGHLLGLSPAFTVLDQADAADLFGLVRHDLGLDARADDATVVDTDRARPANRPRRFPRKDTLAAIYSRVVNAGTRLQDVLDNAYPWCRDETDGIRATFAAYTQRKREQQVLDYDDLLLCWRSLAQVPGGDRLMGGLFDHVLVDEYQDTNALQGDILASLRPNGRGLSVVGDDAQAIYSFRAATARNILEFPTRFPDTEIVRLEQSYRCAPPILAMANAVMTQATEGYGKELWSARTGEHLPRLRTCADEVTQATAVCDAVLAPREAGIDLHRQAVLFRAAHHADVLELELGRRNVPFVKYGGLKFLEAAHVKDLLALLRLLDNPYDELAWFRVLQLLDGVGAATARRVMTELGVRTSAPTGFSPDAANVAPGDPAVDPVARLLAAPPRVAPAGREELSLLRAALADCTATGMPPAAEIDRLRRFLDPVVARTYDAPTARTADLEQLAGVASQYPSRSRFLSDITLDPPSSTEDLAGPPLLDEDWLVLSTVHSAKGLEWEVVHIIHAADGMFPSDMSTGDVESIDEERRLFYVAITRARDRLEVNVPLRYHHHRHRLDDAHGYSQLSRFLTPDVRDLMACEHVGPSVSDDPMVIAGIAAGPRTMAPVDDYLAGLWS
jgi:DNA helicase-2/ATP-dependent DNA helicase PcrA